MPVLSNPALWRKRHASKGYLYIHQPRIVFRARVANTTFSYPVASVDYYDAIGSVLDVRPGMTIVFGSNAGLSDLGRQRIRVSPAQSSSTAGTLFIGWSSAGKRDGEVALATGAYIEVWDDYRVWAKIPRILDSGQIFKDFNIAPGNFPVQIPPVANDGPPRAGFVSELTGRFVVAFDALDASAPSRAIADGASLVSYNRDVGDGVYISGSASSAAAVVAFPAGFRYVHLTVTDSNGQTHTTHTPVYAATRTGENAPHTRFTVSRTLRAEGQTATFEFFEDLPANTYPDGTLVIYWEEEQYGGLPGSLTGKPVKFWGWHQSDSSRIAEASSYIQRDLRLNCIDVAGRLAALPAFPLILERKQTASKWTEMRGADMNRYVHHILHWHSTALTVADFVPSTLAALYPFPALESDGSTLFEQANSRAAAIAHKLTCNSWGRLALVGHPQEQIETERTSEVIVALQASDYSRMEYENNHPPRSHWLQGAAIIAVAQDASAARIEPIFALAPGNAPGQGATSSSKSYQLVRSRQELRLRTGHQYAAINAVRGAIRLALTRGGDAGIEPADMTWVQIASGGPQDRRRGSPVGKRLLPMEVSIQHDNEAGTNSVSLMLQEEIIGTEAVDYFPPTLDWPPYSDYVYIPPRIVWGSDFFDVGDLAEELGITPALMGFALILNDGGKLARTFTLTLDEVIWENVTISHGSTARDVAGRLTGSTMPVRVVSTSGSTGYVHRCDDIFGTVNWVLEDTFSITGSNPQAAKMRIIASKTSDFWAVAWPSQDGVRVRRYTSGSWGLTTFVNSSAFTAVVAGLDLGVAMDGGQIIAPGLNAANQWRLYRATGAGSFSSVGSINYGGMPNVIQPDGDGRLYVGSRGATIAEILSANFSGASQYFSSISVISNTFNIFTPNLDGVTMGWYTNGLPAGQSLTVEWTLNDYVSVPTEIALPTYLHVTSETNNQSLNGARVRYTVQVYNAANTLIGTRTGNMLFNADQTIVVSPFYTSYILREDVYVDLPLEGIKRIRVTLETLDSIPKASGNYWEAFLAIGWPSNDAPYLASRIYWVNSISTTGAAFDRIDDYATSPAATDIRYDGQYVPFDKAGVAVDALDTTRITYVGESGAAVRLASSANRGATYGTVQSSGVDAYEWVKRAGDLHVVGGVGRFDMGFGTSALISRIGNLSEAIGSIGTIEQAVLVFVAAE